MWKVIRVVLGIGVALWLLNAILPKTEIRQSPAPIVDGYQNKSAEGVAAATPVPLQVFPPWYVVAAFDDNEVAAEVRFKNRVALRGTVHSIETGAISGAWVSLAMEHDGHLDEDALRCEFDDNNARALMQLHRGQTVTLSGERARKIMGTVFFHDCAIEPESMQ